MYNTKPELIGIYNVGVTGHGGGSGGGGGGGDVSITVPAASAANLGVVITGNTHSDTVTSETANVVPTLWWMQQEVQRLDNAISGGISYTPISSTTIN